jgi:DNA (cytosine-5)-methyltransferase 1
VNGRPILLPRIREPHTIADAPDVARDREPGQDSIFAIPEIRSARSGLHAQGLVVDLFAGGGGASEGVRRALGAAPDIAVNHDPAAIQMHQLNHPGTKHYRASVFEVSPQDVTAGHPVQLLWASPDCRSHSKARGAAPVSPHARSLPYVVVDWAAAVAPRVIMLENVRELVEWGPVIPKIGSDGAPQRDPQGRPLYVADPTRKGETFREFTGQLEALGYTVDHRILKAHKLGAATRRHRLFLIARRDGNPIVWPEATHGPKTGRPYATALDHLDRTAPGISILTRPDPLAERTQARIAHGLQRFVLGARSPVLIPSPDGRGTDAAFITKYYSGPHNNQGLDVPLHTIVTKARFFLIRARLAATDRHAPTVAGWMESRGIAPTSLVQTPEGPRGIRDMSMRGLTPRELANCQGFGPDFQLGGSVADNIKRIGNSVPPQMVEHLVRANLPEAAVAAHP